MINAQNENEKSRHMQYYHGEEAAERNWGTGGKVGKINGKLKVNQPCSEEKKETSHFSASTVGPAQTCEQQGFGWGYAGGLWLNPCPLPPPCLDPPHPQLACYCPSYNPQASCVRFPGSTSQQRDMITAESKSFWDGDAGMSLTMESFPLSHFSVHRAK